MKRGLTLKWKAAIIFVLILLYPTVQSQTTNHQLQNTSNLNHFLGKWFPCKSVMCEIGALYTKKELRKLTKSAVIFNRDSAVFFDTKIYSPSYKIEIGTFDYCNESDYEGLSTGDTVNTFNVFFAGTSNYQFAIIKDTLIINWGGLIIFLKKISNTADTIDINRSLLPTGINDSKPNNQ